MTVEVGATLYGFCDGLFGRDSYNNKIIEALGVDWCVTRDDLTGEPLFARSHAPRKDIRPALARHVTPPINEE